MSRNLDRLRKGERWWAAEAAFRGVGILLLSACYRLWAVALRSVTAPQPHRATLGEFAVCLAIAGCLTGGLTLTRVGPKLFEHVPIPKHSPYSPEP